MVKLDDVAKLAGVSKGTASRVLNNRGYISQQTRERIEAAVKELGAVFVQPAPAHRFLPKLRRDGLRLCQPQHELWGVEQFFLQSAQPNGILPHLRILHNGV